MDIVDGQGKVASGMHGYIFNTEQHKNGGGGFGCPAHLSANSSDTSARSACAVIPHRFNLPCRPSSLDVTAKARTRACGTIGWDNINASIAAITPHLSVPLLREPHVSRASTPDSELCRFYSERIGVAIAWKTLLVPFNSCERFTNPIILGVPTIGHPYYQCTRELDPEGTFLCADGACVNRTVEKLRAGALTAEFQRLRQRVLAQMSDAALARSYRDLFATVLATKVNV